MPAFTHAHFAEGWQLRRQTQLARALTSTSVVGGSSGRNLKLRAQWRTVFKTQCGVKITPKAGRACAIAVPQYCVIK
jgi:hypothetical protein